MRMWFDYHTSGWLQVVRKQMHTIGVVGKILHFINPNIVLSKTYLVPRSPVMKEKGDRSHFYNEISVQDWFETSQLVKLFGEKGYVSFKV